MTGLAVALLVVFAVAAWEMARAAAPHLDRVVPIGAAAASALLIALLRQFDDAPLWAFLLPLALILFVLGTIVVFDSYRLGSKWGSDGPQSGYFPFYIGLLICLASAVTFATMFVGGM